MNRAAAAAILINSYLLDEKKFPHGIGNTLLAFVWFHLIFPFHSQSGSTQREDAGSRFVICIAMFSRLIRPPHVSFHFCQIIAQFVDPCTILNKQKSEIRKQKSKQLPNKTKVGNATRSHVPNATLKKKAWGG